MTYESGVDWRVTHFGRERRRVQDRYAWDNRSRRPSELCVFQYTLSGALAFERRRQLASVPAGHAAVFHYGDPSSYRVDATLGVPYETEWVNLAGAGVRAHWDALRARHGSVLDLRRQPMVVRSLRRMIQRSAPGGGRDPWAAVEAVHQFVTTLSRAAGAVADARSSGVQRAIERLCCNPTYPWSLKALASEEGCSREYLSRAFQREVGTSPGRFLNAARLRVARELLRESALSIAEVAQQCGLGSVHTLARAMRASEGMSPSEYRRKQVAGSP